MFEPNMKDAFWGFVVGDAFGVPYEFLSREEMKQNPATDEMIGFGTYDQPAGTWSDDTSMMLCVIENMKNNGDMFSLSKLFVKWASEGYHTPYGEAFDIGITTRMAIERLMDGADPRESGSSDEQSAGNGSLMRTVPYALTKKPFSKMMLQMFMEHRITHQLGVCSEASYFYAAMLNALANGQSKEDALKRARGKLKFGWRIVDHDDEEEFLLYTQKFHRLLHSDFLSLNEEYISSSGYVLDTLEAVLWAFMGSSSYKDAIIRAVNLGNDTDTIAALTGALAGVYYGYENIPNEWLEKIIRKDDLIKQFPFL